MRLQKEIKSFRVIHLGSLPRQERASGWFFPSSSTHLLSAMEIEEGVNVASMIDDEVDCPLLVDAASHTLTRS